MVAGTTEVGEPMTFYSPDHPAPFTPGELWSSGLTSLEEAKRLGFIGICDTTDGRLPVCEAWMAANAPDAERSPSPRSVSSTAIPGPAISWKIYIGEVTRSVIPGRTKVRTRLSFISMRNCHQVWRTIP